jgi:hypothetical protein
MEQSEKLPVVEFRRTQDNIHGTEKGTVYARIKEGEKALRLWKLAISLNIEVWIDNNNWGNSWGARHAIEDLFGISYTLKKEE